MTASKRLTLIAFAILASLLGVGTAAAATKYKVRIESVPTGASVSVDKAVVGTTPWSGSLTKGNHTITVELTGYAPTTTTMNVLRTKKLQTKTLTLVKLDDPPKIDIRADADQNIYDANVWLDGQAAGRAPIILTTTVGRHQIILKKEGFKDFETWVEGKANGITTLTPFLKEIEKPKLGWVVVEADVSSAEVYLDGDLKGTTPIVIKDINEGIHVVEVKKSPAVPWKQTIGVEANKETKVSAGLQATIVAQGGAIKVLSNVAAAHVFLDGKDMGQQPVELKDVKPGEHIIEVKSEGYVNREEPVVVNAGSSTVLKIDLNPEAKTEARLKVSSPVPDADVYVDGASVGKVPVDMPIAAGEHFVIVQLDGYKKFEATVRVEAGQTQTVPAVLKAVGKLLILSDPPKATVLINGLPIGETPLDLKELDVGDTVVRLEMEGRIPQERTLKIVGGESQTLSIKLDMIGMTDAEKLAEQRGLSSFGARTLPRGRSTIDLGIGYPYLGEVKVTVGAGKKDAKYGFDAGVSARSFGARSELGLGVRVMLVNNDPFTAGVFSDIWWGSKLLDNSKRNGLTFNLGGAASLTALTRVTVSGRLYLNMWSDRHCPSWDALNNDFEADSEPIHSCEVYRDVRVLNTRTDAPGMNYADRMEKATGESGLGMFDRESGMRVNATIIAEIAIQQQWNMWFMLEGAFPGERALLTDQFADPMLQTDFQTYGRMGATYKF